jgi:hypothetical protein
MNQQANRATMHHFVPRSYLARFADDSGFLHVFDRSSNSIRRQRPSNIMKINSYYRQTWAPMGIDPDILETTLGKGLERETKESLDKLIDEPANLTEQDVANLLTYIELQRIRVPRQADTTKKLMRDLILRLAPKDIQAEINSGKSSLTIKDAARFDLMRMAIGSMSPWLGSMEWEVFKAEPGAAFITTDSPVSFYNGSLPPPAEAGLAYAGTMVFFPLSSKYALVMRHPEYKDDSALSRLDVLPTPELNDGHIPIIHGGVWDQEVVDSFNWKMARLSQNLIVGCSEEILRRCE